MSVYDEFRDYDEENVLPQVLYEYALCMQTCLLPLSYFGSYVYARA